MFTKKHKEIDAHDEGIWCCAWSKFDKESSEVICTGSVDDTLKIWKWSKEGLELRHTCIGGKLGITSVELNKPGSFVVSSSLDSRIRVFDVESSKPINVIDASPADAWTITLSPEGKTIAAGTYTGKINIWSTDTGKKEYELHDTQGKFTMSVKYSPNGRYLASGSIDGFVNVYDTQNSNKRLFSMEVHAGPIRSVVFSGNSGLLCTASDDGFIKVFELKTKKMVNSFKGHDSYALSVDFSSDNNFIISGSSDRTVKVWERLENKCKHTFYDHLDQVWGVKYSPNNNSILSVSEDRTINIYEAIQLKPVL